MKKNNREVTFLNNQVRISIPQELRALTEQELAEQKMSSIVEHVYQNEQGVMLSVNFADKSEDTLEELLQKTYYAISSVTPGFQGFGASKREQNGILLGVMQYKSNMLVKELYNSMMLCSINNKTLIMSAHCDWAEYVKWKDVFFEIYESIELQAQNK